MKPRIKKSIANTPKPYGVWLKKLTSTIKHTILALMRTTLLFKNLPSTGHTKYEFIILQK
jgi:hypothetical protein